MNYQKIHDLLINRALVRSKGENILYEEHHILPRCLGGTDDDNNLVLLTLREHFLIHQILVKLYPKNYRILYAAFLMSKRSDGRASTGRRYEWIRTLHRRHMVENNPNKGGFSRREYIKKHGHPKGDHSNKEETRKRTSERMKKNNPVYSLDRNPNARYVHKICPSTLETVHVYTNMYEAIKEEGFTSAIYYNMKRNKIYKGYLWKTSKEEYL